MSADIKINFSDICPYLRSNKIQLDPLVIHTETETDGGEGCYVGENVVLGEIESDLMLKPTTIKIEVSCEGCKLLPEGFSQIVKSKIK